jgi:hypothetical protein
VHIGRDWREEQRRGRDWREEQRRTVVATFEFCSFLGVVSSSSILHFFDVSSVETNYLIVYSGICIQWL